MHKYSAAVCASATISNCLRTKRKIPLYDLRTGGNVRDQTTGSRTWVMFTRKRQDMRSFCLANHVTPATPVTETKNCLYISRHTPLFGALVRFCCARWDLDPSVLEIKLSSCLCITVVDLLSLYVGSEIRARSITISIHNIASNNCRIHILFKTK